MTKQTKTVSIYDEFGLDLEFFEYIHGRKPRNEDEFMEFRYKLDAREKKNKSNLINISEMSTATRGRQNPFEKTQNEYDGWDGEDY